MKNYIYIFTITYSFDSNYFARKCNSYEEAVKILDNILQEEIKTVQNENGYTPSVIKQSEDEATLIYAEGKKENHYTEDFSTYKIFEVEI